MADTDDDFVKDAIDTLSDAKEGWQDIYDLADEDLRFYAGDQWDAKVYSERTRSGRHCVTINRLPQFVHQVANEIRQNSPTAKFLPADGGADEETAEMLQDLFRNCEYVSRASVAYDTAAENAIKCSLGWIRLDHGYTAPDTFEQQILIKRVVNPLSIIIDPMSTECDGSDATYGFAMETMSKDEFKRQFPDANPLSFDKGYILQNAKPFSCGDNAVTIAEYFKQEAEKRDILLLETGEIVFADEYQKLSMPVPIKSERTIMKNKVMRYKMSGVEVLEKTKFPSSYIPLVPVYGEEHWYDGERHLISLIRNAKEAQMMYNYLQSLKAEGLQKAPKSPWLIAEGQVKGYEKDWKNPDAVQVLQYKTVTLNGQTVAPPARIAPPPVSQGLVEGSLQAIDDMKASMGIYDPSLANEGQEKSGRAIIATQKQGQTATLHFQDNLSRSITHVGKIWLDMLPEVCDTPRIMRTLGEDKAVGSVMVNGMVQGADMTKYDRIYDINVGKYDVVVTTGPSYATKRLEEADKLMQLSQANPIFGQALPDMLIDVIDIPGMDKEKAKARLKRSLPPQLTAGEDETEQSATAKLQQVTGEFGKIKQEHDMLQQGLIKADQVNEQLQAENAQLQNELKNKAVDTQLKAQSDQMNFEIKLKELDNDREQLALDREQFETETLMKMVSIKTQPQGAVEQGDEDMGAGKDALIAKLQAIEAKEQQDAMNVQMQAENEANEKAMKDAKDAALMQGIVGIQSAVVELINTIRTPTQTILQKDPSTGLTVGAIQQKVE